MNRRMRLLAPAAIVVAVILGLVGLDLTAESREARDEVLTAESVAMEAMASRYGTGAPRTIEELEGRIAQARAIGQTLPAGYGRVNGRAQAAQRAGRGIPRLTDTGGRESHGFIVLPPFDPELMSPTAPRRAVAPEFIIQSTVHEYFDGIVFMIKSFRDEDLAQEAFDVLSMSPSPGEFATDELFTWVEVRGRPAKLIDYHNPIEAWVETSQLTWIEGDTMYTIRSYEGEVPVGELLRIAESLTFD